MSGHSKFANIKHKKEKNDAKKGKIFTIIGREIVMAVKAGGPDPNNNGKLRDVIAKAKANNMPNDTIERGIKKAAGADSADSYEKAVYEGYGPNGVAIIVETLTDNKNRTASNVRNAFTKGNGSIGTQGCVSYMFDQKGQIIIDKEECEMDADELMMTALDAGAEDFNEEEDSYEVLTAPDDLGAVREALEAAGVPLLEAQVAMIPQTTVELTDEKSLKDIQRILDLLDSKKIPSCRIALRQVASNDTSPSAAVRFCLVIGNSNSISYYNIKKNSIHTWQINVLRASLKKTPAFIYFESSSFYISAKQTFHLPAASPYRKASWISRLPSPLSSLQSQTHSHFPEERRSAGFLQLQQVQVL